MGLFPAYDGGETFGFVGPFLHFSLANDHVVLINVRPEAPERTTIELLWLVDGAAREGEDYDPARLRWLWESTVLQDRDLVERAQRGVRSRVYRPGAYAPLEVDSMNFKRWYLRRASVALQSGSPALPDSAERVAPPAGASQTAHRRQHQPGLYDQVDERVGRDAGAEIAAAEEVDSG
jgi:hypothetical protein